LTFDCDKYDDDSDSDDHYDYNDGEELGEEEIFIVISYM